MVRTFPREIILPLEDWEEVLKPLLRLQEEMLASPRSGSPWKRGFCDHCRIFYIIHDLLLHLMFFRGASCPMLPKALPPLQSSDSEFGLVTAAEGNSQADLDDCLTALLAELKSWKVCDIC